MPKVVKIDNYGRETVADVLVKDGLTVIEARDLCEKMNENRSDNDWYVVKVDEYVLWRGMEDII